MREAVGSSMLLYIVVFLVGIVIIFFAGILTYSKAYKAKNRIIEVIEEYDGDLTQATSVISDSLKVMGYQMGNCPKNDSVITNPGYKYCVFLKSNSDGTHYYVIEAYTHFDFPLIGSLFSFPVRGETGILGKDYSSL